MSTPTRLLPIAIICFLVLLTLQTNQTASAEPEAADCEAPNIVCIEGTLSADTTWTAANVYVLDGYLTVASNTTLTIEAGTIIKSRYEGLIIEGTLNSNGTAASPVIFTSLRDDSVGGDTEANGESEPRSNDWNNLQFLAGSTGNLTHTEIRYFGSATDARGAIANRGGTLSLDNITLTDGYPSYAAITTNAENIPTISNLTISPMKYSGVRIHDDELTTDATLQNQNVIYYLLGDLTIKNSASLTIETGVVIKAHNAELIVDGSLLINGTSADPVIFTSYQDDRIGGDSNGDGFEAISKTTRNWNGIRFLPNSSGTLTGLTIRHANQGITADGATVSIQNCVLTHNRIGLLAGETMPLPTMSNCDIYNNSSSGIKNESTIILEAPNNWWGDSAGPDDRSDADGFENQNSAGQDISNYINYATWATTKIHPELRLELSEMEISTTAGGNSPGIIPVDLVSGTELAWQASATESWATASNANDKFSIQLDTTELLPGDYEAAAIAQWGDPTMPRYDIVELELRVLAAENVAPGLNLDAQEINFFGRETIQAPAPLALTLTNTGTGTLDWTASTSAPWLTISPISGTADAKIELTANIDGLTEGVYDTEILIESPNATNGPFTIPSSLTLGCSNPRPMDVLLVIDRSGSMTSKKLTAAKEAALSFVQLLDFTRDQVAVVAFNDEPTVPQLLSQDAVTISRKIQALRSAGDTKIDLALDAGQNELRSERRISGNLPVMILLSDGQDGGGSDAIATAFSAKAAGTYVVTIGLGNPNEEMLKEIASFENDYYFSPEGNDLISIYNNVATTVSCNVSGTGVEQLYIPIVQK